LATGSEERRDADQRDEKMIISRITRCSFHHLLQPEATLREMARVCRSGDTVTVCDVASAHDKLDAYNRLEKIRDPSHTAALSPGQFEQLFARVGLRPTTREQYRLEISVTEGIASSFPEPGGAEEMRQLFEKGLGVDGLGVGVERRANGLFFYFPILISSART